MSLDRLIRTVTDKANFQSIDSFIEFSIAFLEFAKGGFQATIISQNESYYQFWQYKENGNYNITRPINSNLIYTIDDREKIETDFRRILASLRDFSHDNANETEVVKKTIYTIPQTIGATLDSLRSGRSNIARKLTGDLFEQFIRLLIQEAGIECDSGTVQIPVKENGEDLFKMSYQHDLVFKKDGEKKAFGSVKTSSKDRIDKIFLDKFLYSKLTDTALPHIAIFLNDVQRKNTRRENEYGINSTFLPGHFKGYSIKLNPLDGVYYCDIRPNMVSDEFLNRHIKTIDHFFFEDMWNLID